MTATAFLVSLIFLYSDGTPAKDASVICGPLQSYTFGIDEEQVPGPLTRVSLLLDARGAAIVNATVPFALNCDAAGRDEVWTGSIALAPNQKVIALTLWTAED